MANNNMSKLQTFIVMASLILFPFFSHAESCDGFQDPTVLNLLKYNIGLGSNFSSQTPLIRIEKGQEQSCLGNYKKFYVERYLEGADPWEFNLCHLHVDDDQSILFVLTKEGLFVLKNMNVRDVSNLDLDIIKDRAIERLLPLD